MNLVTPPLPTPATIPAKLRCIVLSGLAELTQVAPDWEALLGRSSANELMLAPLWLLPWWEVYGSTGGRRLCVGLFYEHDRLVGLAPLQRRCYWYRPGIPLRRLEPLGADVDEGDGVCSEYLNVIAEQGGEGRVATALVEALQSGRFGSWDELLLSSMDGEGPMPALLAAACQRAGLRTAIQTTSAAPYVPLPASWDDYLRSLGKDKRYVVKTLRDFEDWAGGTSIYQQAATAAEREQGQAILQALHAERWQSAGQKGVFRATRFARFHERVMRQALERGLLQLVWLSAHGRPLAAVYNLCWNNKVYFYQSGRALDVPKNVRAGIVLHAHCIRAAIAAGYREYDFLAGLSQYKQQLAPACRPVVQFRAWRPGLRERARLLGEQGLSLLRRVRNRLLRKKEG